jgi:hypothetical protein
MYVCLNKDQGSLLLRQSRVLRLSFRCHLDRIGMPAVDAVTIATDLNQMNRGGYKSDQQANAYNRDTGIYHSPNAPHNNFLFSDYLRNDGMHGSTHALIHGHGFFRSRKPNAPINEEHLADESDHHEHREKQNKNHPITFVMVYGVIACFDSVRVRHTYLLFWFF